MSYVISFKAKLENVDKYMQVGYCYATIPYEYGAALREATGLEWKTNENNGYCLDVMPKMAIGVQNFMKDMSDSSNVKLIKFVLDILYCWQTLEKQEPEIAKVATLWIE